MNLADLMERFSTVDAARDYLEKQRWPDGPECPHCGLVGEAYKITPKPRPADTEYQTKREVEAKSKRVRKPRQGLWKCSGCRKPFTVTVGTIFEDSHIPLNKWVIAVHLLCASKKGMSAHQLHRMLGVTYKSAWFMAHRIRYGMSQEPLASQLNGVVEADEAYVGGRRRDRGHAIKAGERQQDRPAPMAGKEAVFSVLQRGGRVRSTHLDRVIGSTLRAAINEVCAPDAHVITDQAAYYKGLKNDGRKHSSVNHKAKEYVRWDDGVCITTNTIEGFFSILKRGINGTYHHVSKQHLHRYLSEFDFRFNAREMSDSDRREAALKGFGGKRLMLHDPTGKTDKTS